MNKEVCYHILVNVRTAQGFECIGKFMAGHDKGFADNLFRQLQGSEIVNENTMLTFELMESRKELPFNLKIISCSLEEHTVNCKLIARELFKQLNLKEI